MACGIIGENAESAVERRKVRGGRFIQSDEVDAGRDRATRGCRSVFWGSVLLTRLVGPVSLTFSLPSSLSPPRSPQGTWTPTRAVTWASSSSRSTCPNTPCSVISRQPLLLYFLPPPLYANETFSFPPLPSPLLAPLSPRSPPVSDVCYRSQGVWDRRRHSRSPGNGGAMAA
jgi:hypothetical protein